MSKNILHIISILEIWWAQKVAINLYKDFEENFKYKNYFLSIYNKNDFKNENIKYISLNEKKWSIFSNILKLFYRPYRVNKIVKELKIDLIISHWEESNFISIILWILNKNLKVIPLIHWDIRKNYKWNFIYNFLIKFFYKKKNIFCVSEELKYLISDYYKININKIGVITNYFSWKFLENWTTDELINDWKIKLITVWRLVDLKNHIEMIKIFNLLETRKFHLYIIWEWENRKNIENFIEEKWLWKSITLLWEKNNPIDYIKKCDIFLLTSKWEWYPIVLLESIYSWIPIISYNTTSWPNEILNNNKYVNQKIEWYKILQNWILVEYWNIESFAEAISFLSKNNHIYNELKKNIDKNKYFFSKEFILKRWLEILQWF